MPVVLPLLGAALTLLLASWRRLQRVAALTVVVGCLGVAVALLVGVEADGIAAVEVGAWPNTIGITLAVDLMSALFLVTAIATVLAVLVFAAGQESDETLSPIFYPVYLVLVAGVSLSFITADLFNLFVAFEVMLIASYVLLTLGGGLSQIRAGMTYVVINVLASTLFITAVAFIYAATGTVNMAELIERYAELPDAIRLSIGLFLLLVFGIKAAMFPLFFWLPDSYPTAPTSITAVFAGLLTKVGIYSIIRTQTLLELDELSTVILVLAGLTMVIGVIGALAQNDLKRLLSFDIISQIGYMLMGLGLFTVGGVSAAVLYVVHTIPVKTSLFLVVGVIEKGAGTSHLDRLGGLGRRAPVLGLLFLLPALSLAGVPPLSGFIGKLALVEAGLDSGSYPIVVAGLTTSLLTLFVMSTIWAQAFWRTPIPDPTPAMRGEGRLRLPRVMSWATGGAVAITLVIAALAGPLYQLSERAAETLLDHQAYVEAVRGDG